ncbi:thioredoxin-like protein [Piromyces finnis]|uniref:Thioredoxin-like protein n=1 Tax=Piromyces finnis TaxID=1754191 RepID=A0A1Y1VDN1_9FUNG|nr:thioredoxin-like protein [Piromyces finnis]|eukprot:ORX53442.1 thioredoxin-like protein [Piromyces finnis]
MSSNRLKILHWSDYACPFCVIGDKRLNEVLEECNIKDRVDFEMKAYQLDKDAPKKPHLKMEEVFAKKFGISIEGARDRVDRIAGIGRNEGLDIKFATVQFTNTFDAHRLTKYIASQGKDVEKFIDLTFKAYFSDNLNIADRNLLIDIAEKAGIDKKDASKILKGKEFSDEVRKDEEEASDKGIRSIPHYIVNGKYVISSSEKSEMKFVLEQVLKDEAEGKLNINE